MRFSSAYSKSTNSLLLSSFKSTQTEVDADAKVDALKLLQWREILCPLVKIYGDEVKENTLFARSNGLVEDVEQAGHRAAIFVREYKEDLNQLDSTIKMVSFQCSSACLVFKPNEEEKALFSIYNNLKSFVLNVIRIEINGAFV